MFSGIVEALGKVIYIEDIEGCKQLTISYPTHFKDLLVGDSMSVNGVCLTITALTHQSFNVTVVPETLRQTNLGYLAVNDIVNLERALTLLRRIGGHYVQGHVDEVGEILEITPDQSKALLMTMSIPQHLSKYLVAKGYITLDGMSVTIIHAATTWFTTTLIPHTQVNTITNRYRVGSLVNIEVDIVSKYIEKLMGASTNVNVH